MNQMKTILGKKIGIMLKFLILSFIIYLFINLIYFSALLIAFYQGALPMIHEPAEYAYSNYSGILISLLLFSFFILAYLVPTKKTEWKRAGLYEAFIIALFTEMYGFPLTIYTISWISGKNLGLGHVEGHLMAVLLSNAGLSLTGAWLWVMVISSVMLLLGIFMIYAGWKNIYSADDLETGGIYQYMRHPQYLGLFIVITGFMVQWPTILTLLMWPILLITYYKLAQKEETGLADRFGTAYLEYKAKVPMFFPRLRHHEM